MIDALCILNNKTPKKGVILASEARGIGWEHREELLDIKRSLFLLGQRPVIACVEPWADHGPGLLTSLARCTGASPRAGAHFRLVPPRYAGIA